MALMQERSVVERDKLFFPSAEEASAWREQVMERLSHQEKRSVRKRRETVAEEVAREFEKYGEGVGMIIRPWEHTPEEHAEVQQLVDVAFDKDLSAALRAARASAYYPRNIDLFHDVLTTEMYDMLREHGLHRQPVVGWLLAALAIVGVTFFIMLWLVLF